MLLLVTEGVSTYAYNGTECLRINATIHEIIIINIIIIIIQ
jgi:hypothetical protein